MTAATSEPAKRKSSLTKEQRVLRARAAALAMHSQGKTNTEAARARAPQSLAYWFDKIDPDRTLSESERITRAEQGRRSYMLRLSLAASRARQAKRERKAQDDATQ